MRLVPFVLVTLALAGTGDATAQDVPHLLGTDRLGPAHELTRSGSTVYLAAGAALLVIDVSDPTGVPPALGRLDLDFLPLELRVDGTLLAAAAGERGLVLFDVSDPHRPVELARLATAHQVLDVALRPGLALVAEAERSGSPGPGDPRGLVVVDLSDPSNPVAIGSFPFGTEGASEVSAWGDRVYVAQRAGGDVSILDVSDPAHPALLGTSGSCGRDLVVSGNGRRIYCLHRPPHDDGNEIRIFDVQDPAHPVLAGSLYDPFEYSAFAVVWQRLYATSRSDGLEVFDVSDPAAPVQVGLLPTLGAAFDLALGGDVLYAAAGARGLRLVDVSGWPEELGGIDSMPGTGGGVAFEAGRAYLTGDDDRLRILDVSDPAYVTELLSWGGTGDPLASLDGDLAVAAGRLYLIDVRGLHVADVTGGGPPHPLGRFPTLDQPFALAVDGSLAFVVSRPYPETVLQVVDVSDPVHPAEVGRFTAENWLPQVLRPDGDLLLAAGGVFGGCRILDVSDPTTPIEVGSCAVDSYSWDLAVDGDLVYLAGGEGVHVLDLSDPAAPLEIGTLATGETREARLALSRDLLYLTSHGEPMRLVDVSEPTQPVSLGSAPRATGETPDFLSADPADLIAVDGHAFLVERAAGLSIWSAPLFADGFESGDASAWSSVNP